MNYSPRTVVSSYRVESHCPAILGRAFGAIGIPGFRAQAVSVTPSHLGTAVSVTGWNGLVRNELIEPVQPTKVALDRVVRRFM